MQNQLLTCLLLMVPRMPLDSNPLIYSDRMAVGELEMSDKLLFDAMQEWGIGKVDGNGHLQFCGMVRSKDGKIAVFLPVAMPDRSVESAKLTMRALARYGSEASARNFSDDGEHGNPGALAVIKSLADDFRQKGLFQERQRVRARNNGKPDWKRTVTREQAFPSGDGGLIYPDLATTRAVNSSDILLAQVQAAVLSEIIEQHGWWVDGLHARRAELRWQKMPHQPRNLWPVLLDALLPSLYSERSIFLARYLGYYLRDSRASAAGSCVFGIEDFHTVWEVMLRQTLLNVESNWNARLPCAVYETVSGDISDAAKRGMRTDIILRDEVGFTIIDAKYYAANSTATVPGWPDIAKQMLYELALRSVVGAGARIHNCFVFPSDNEAEGKFVQVAVRKKIDGTYLEDFPKITCYYLPIFLVMSSYYRHQRDILFPIN